MYVECENEKKYQNESNDFLKRLEPDARKKLIIAIDDLFQSEKRISWKFIATALRKKSVECWNMHGGGLLFNDRFYACVLEQMRRDDIADHIDPDEYFLGIAEEYSGGKHE